MGFEDVRQLELHTMFLVPGPLGARCVLAQGASHGEYSVDILFYAC
jgi:hypothetical protein